MIDIGKIYQPRKYQSYWYMYRRNTTYIEVSCDKEIDEINFIGMKFLSDFIYLHICKSIFKIEINA